MACLKLGSDEIRGLIEHELGRLDEIQRFWWVEREWPKAAREFRRVTGRPDEWDFETMGPEGEQMQDDEVPPSLLALNRRTGENLIWDPGANVWWRDDEDGQPTTQYTPQTPGRLAVDGAQKKGKRLAEMDPRTSHTSAAGRPESLMRVMTQFETSLAALLSDRGMSKNRADGYVRMLSDEVREMLDRVLSRVG